MGVKTHAALWASLIMLILYLIGHYTLPNGPDNARIVINSLVIGVNLAVCLTWAKRAYASLRTGISTGTDNIFVGVWLGSVVSLAYFVYLVIVIGYDLREWSRHVPIGGIFTVGFFLSASSLLLTPLNTKEDIEPVSMRWWILAVGISMFIAGSIMTLAFLGVVALGSV